LLRLLAPFNRSRGEGAEPDQPVHRHATAIDRQRHALADIAAQQLLEFGAIRDRLAVEFQHEVASLQICIGRRRAPDDLANLHTARAQRLFLVRGQAAEPRSERQAVMYVVARNQCIVGRWFVEKNFVRTDAASLFDRPITRMASACRIVTVADPDETATDKGQPPNNWQSVFGGPGWEWDEKTQQYAHLSGVLVLTPDGRLSRYFYGVEYSPKELRLALFESGQGHIGSLVDELLLFCYHYDPANGRYGAVVMNLVRAGGVLTVLALGAFILFMRRQEKLRHLEGHA